MMNNGWIKIHRKLIDNCIYKDSELLHLLIHCLIKANHKENTFLFNGNMVKVERGQFISGRFEISRETKIKTSSVYRKLKVLENLGILNIKSNNKFSVITVIKYNTYQDILTTSEQQTEQQLNNKRTTTEQQLNTNKNDKNEENENNEKREETLPPNFIDELAELFSDNYRNHKGVEYVIQEKDKKAVGMLLAVYKKKNPESNSDKCKSDFNNLFNAACSINDDKFLSQITLSTLNSQINQYTNYIRNGKSTKAKSGYSKGFDVGKNTWYTGT